MVNTKITKAKPGHRCSICGKRFPTEEEWNQHTIQCARELREELTYECPDCDYATKRERDLKRHRESAHKIENAQKEREKTDIVDDLGKDPGDLHDLIGLGKPSKPTAGDKRKSVDDAPVFAPPRKVCRVSQGEASDRNKTKSKPAEESKKKPANVEKETVTGASAGSSSSQAMSDGEQKDTERCECGVQTSPVKKRVHHSVTRTVTYRDNNKKIKEVEVEEWDSESE